MTHSTVGLPRLTAATPLPAILDALDTAGCAVIERLADEQTVDQVLDELKPHMNATATGGDEISGKLTRRTGAVPARSPASWQMIQNTTILAIAEHYLSGPGEQFHLCTAVTSDLLPGQEAQPIHRDQWTYGGFPWPSGFEVEINILWAMQEFTEQNGATRAIPGSHRWDDGLELQQDQTIPVTAPAGSAIVMLGSCYHGAGANRSATNRVALSIAYQRAWLRQGENQYLNCPPDVAATMPDDLVRLLGYQRGCTALGYWRDGEDPMVAVHPNRTYHVGLGLGPKSPED